MWEVWVLLLVFIFHHWWMSSVHLSKNYLITYILILLISYSRNELSVYSDEIAMVFFHTFLNHVFYETIEWLNLLVNHTILSKESINDIPLIIWRNLSLTIFFNFWLYELGFLITTIWSLPLVKLFSLTELKIMKCLLHFILILTHWWSN